MADEEKTSQLINDIQKFNEICYLFDHIQQISEKGREISLRNDGKFKNFSMIDDDPGIVIQELIGKKGVEKLFQLTPAQKALLVPKIELFKVVYKDENDKKGTDLPFVFRDFIDTKHLDDITNNGADRGDNIGIKSFEYEIGGKNPAEGGLIICKINLFFRTMRELVAESSSDRVSFRDLILHTGAKNNSNKKVVEREPYESRNYRIKAVVGWAYPSDPKEVVMNKELLKAIKASKSVFFLTLVKHDLNFNENGSIEAVLEYRGALEGILNTDNSNILYLTKSGEKAKQIKEKEAQRKKEEEENKLANGQDSSEPKPETNTDIIEKEPKTEEEKRQKELLELDVADKQEKYSRLISALYEKNKMYYIEVDANEINPPENKIRNVLNSGVTEEKAKTALLYERERNISKKPIIIHRITDTPYKQELEKPINEALENIGLFSVEGISSWFSSNKIRRRTQEEMDKEFSNIENNSNTKTENGKKRVNFFYLGDLIDVALNVLTANYRNDNYNVRVLIGPYVYENPTTKQIEKINLADIPISLNTFMSWYIDKVIKPQTDTYYLGNFIKDVISDLVTSALAKDKCFVDISKMSPNISISLLTLPDTNPALKNIKGARLTINALKGNILDKKIVPESEYYDNKNLAHYLYIFVSNQSFSSFKANQKEDIDRGIYHLNLASDIGLVKEIRFTKMMAPYGKEVAATGDSTSQERYSGYYNANIKMIGNCLFMVGSRIFINTSSLAYFLGSNANLVANKMRLGGYYLITKVSHIVSKDENTTDIEARWDQDSNGTKTGGTLRKVSSKEAAARTHAEVMQKVENEEAENNTKIKMWSGIGGIGGFRR